MLAVDEGSFKICSYTLYKLSSSIFQKVFLAGKPNEQEQEIDHQWHRIDVDYNSVSRVSTSQRYKYTVGCFESENWRSQACDLIVWFEALEGVEDVDTCLAGSVHFEIKTKSWILWSANMHTLIITASNKSSSSHVESNRGCGRCYAMLDTNPLAWCIMRQWHRCVRESHSTSGIVWTLRIVIYTTTGAE